MIVRKETSTEHMGKKSSMHDVHHGIEKLF
jgi:hypothetical protein